MNDAEFLGSVPDFRYTDRIRLSDKPMSFSPPGSDVNSSGETSISLFFYKQRDGPIPDEIPAKTIIYTSGQSGTNKRKSCHDRRVSIPLIGLHTPPLDMMDITARPCQDRKRLTGTAT